MIWSWWTKTVQRVGWDASSGRVGLPFVLYPDIIDRLPSADSSVALKSIADINTSRNNPSVERQSLGS